MIFCRISVLLLRKITGFTVRKFQISIRWVTGIFTQTHKSDLFIKGQLFLNFLNRIHQGRTNNDKRVAGKS